MAICMAPVLVRMESWHNPWIFYHQHIHKGTQNIITQNLILNSDFYKVFISRSDLRNNRCGSHGPEHGAPWYVTLNTSLQTIPHSGNFRSYE